MNWRHFALPAATAFGVAMLPQGALAQKLIKDQIVGAWTIVSQVQTMKDGSTRHPAGMNPKGLNVFTADGQFVVLFMRDDLPKIAAGDRQKATGDEARAVIGGSIGYFGTYTVDEGSKMIVYKIQGTTFPNQMGVEQRRVISLLTADELKYRNPGATTGGQIEVTFKRAAAPRS
jgi:Lipocalin-like domain